MVYLNMPVLNHPTFPNSKTSGYHILSARINIIDPTLDIKYLVLLYKSNPIYEEYKKLYRKIDS